MLEFVFFIGLIFVSYAIDGVARQMREANHLKRAELKARGVSLD